MPWGAAKRMKPSTKLERILKSIDGFDGTGVALSEDLMAQVDKAHALLTAAADELKEAGL
jgi:hypothetical protein